MKKTNNLLCFLLSFAMLVSLLTQVAFAESTNIKNEADFLSALKNTETTEMNITGHVSVDASIEKSIDINVKSGATLTLNYDEGENGISRVCNANIKVEDGANVIFESKPSNDSKAKRYLIMNGSFTLESGASAKISKKSNPVGGILFQGEFKNDGTLDCGAMNIGQPNLYVYIKFGVNSGKVTNGYVAYNLCRETPTDETISNKAIRVTAINGNAEVGETLSAEIDGFGDSRELPKNLITWNGANWEDANIYNNTYTVIFKDVGKKIGAKFNGVGTMGNPISSYPYDYVAVKDNKVTVILNGTSDIETETDTVPYIDTIYLDSIKGSDKNLGVSADKAVASISTAMRLVADGGTIVVCGDVVMSTDSPAYITKNVTFTNTDGENTYQASFTGGTEEDYSLFYSANKEASIKFSGIKFINNVFAASEYAGSKYIFDNISTAENSCIGAFIINGLYLKYEPFAIDVINTKNAEVDILNDQQEGIPAITLDNSSITSAMQGSLGNVSLKNNSKIKTFQPMQTLTADNTDNAIEFLADEANNIIPININGDITISENNPIKLEFETPFTVGQTLFTSTNGNTSLTADKFSISQIELALDKQDNDIVTKAAEYIINYELDGGTLGANSPATHTYGTETILVNPTKSGYNFAGWYLEDTFATKIETLAADGYTSEITLYAKWNKRSSGGGGTTRYTVLFDTNGGSKLSNQTVTRNSVIKEPATPTKDGFDFAGWYTDKELKTKYDFSAKITKSMTLYAAWTEKKTDNSENQIILTIGKKDASVFGKIKTNDVAPKIVNDRTMLPARFVAESLGAVVEWNGDKQLVTIKGKNLKTNEDVTILITIGAEYAVVNGENVKLDSPAFIENDRTYTPIRFISEHLGASVEWLENEQKVIITKNLLAEKEN